MKSITVSLLFAGTAWAAWNVENVPTTFDFFGQYPVTIGTEFSGAYRAIHDAAGVKTGENIVIAYRSVKLRLLLRNGNGWNHMTFADKGRYPSVTLDSQGQPHMSFFRTDTKRVYYAHPVQAGTGNCGPQTSWACEEVPGNLWGDPLGRSAIAITGNTVHIVYEAPWTSQNGQYVFYYSKTIGSAVWTTGPVTAAAGWGIKELALRADPSGGIHLTVVDAESTYWYRKAPGYWDSVGGVNGHGIVAPTSNGAPRMCYRDYATSQLIYATSTGTSSWNPIVLDYDIGSAGACAIAVPAANGYQIVGYYNPRVAYFDASSGAIKYATPPVLGGSTWSVQTAAAATGAKKIELGLDLNTKPAILYFDSSALSIRIARLQ
jgi:hypothetical protein